MARCFSGIAFIRYAQSQNSWNWNNFKFSESKKLKGLNGSFFVNFSKYQAVSVWKESLSQTFQILSAVKEGQQKYCETVYSRSGINHMWILKNSKDLLDNQKSRSFSQVSSIKTFDFSTLYTTLPHDKLKTRLKETIHKAFSHRNYGSKCVVLARLQFHIFFKQNSKR